MVGEALDGRVVLGCQFGPQPGSSPDAPRACAAHDAVVAVAVEVTLTAPGGVADRHHPQGRRPT